MTLYNVGMIGAGAYFTGAHVPAGNYISSLMAYDILVHIQYWLVLVLYEESNNKTKKLDEQEQLNNI